MSLRLTTMIGSTVTYVDLTLMDETASECSTTPPCEWYYSSSRTRSWESTDDGSPPPKRRRQQQHPNDTEDTKVSGIFDFFARIAKKETNRIPNGVHDLQAISIRAVRDITEDPPKWNKWRQRVDHGRMPSVYLPAARQEIVQRINYWMTKDDFKWPSQSPLTSSPSPLGDTERHDGPGYSDTPLPARLQRLDRSDRPFEPLLRLPPVPSNTTCNPWYHAHKRRPYLSALDRHRVAVGLTTRPKRREGQDAAYYDDYSAAELSEIVKEPVVCHVDFTAAEVADIVRQASARIQALAGFQQDFPHTREGLLCLIRNRRDTLPNFITYPQGRTEDDIQQFFSDLLKKREGTGPDASSNDILSIQRSNRRSRAAEHAQDLFPNRASPLLMAREMEGNAGFSRTRRYANFQKDLQRMRQDGLDLIGEYTGAAGDVIPFAWVSNTAFVCGATSHSDGHNQQYNKPGNLLLCSTTDGTLKAYPDHRIERPQGQGVNASETMRRSQDPWIYPSVVASDYDPILKLAFTSGYDNTVKVWSVDDTGRHMGCLATWKHDGIVNFVKCTNDGSGRVATASNCANKPAVRIYAIDPDDSTKVPLEPDQELSCLRQDHLANDGSNWAYYPATMQWGKGPLARHLLAIGYSPRADSGNDIDIPEDKRQTGEITLWDADKRQRVDISNATSANVFEVVWHPTLPRFACATSRCGQFKAGTRTQVHIFKQDIQPRNCYFSSSSLDCPSLDINELTFMPNCANTAYVTAACTDGRVYVWDTGFNNDILHVLRHGPSLEIFDEERREEDDTGVRFTAWGPTLDRFYTGGSDGVVNVWNLQDKHNPFVRKLLPNAPGPISGGAFSPDMQKLAIGDASGRVWLFSVDNRDNREAPPTNKFTPQLARSGGIPMIPHANPTPPPSHEDSDVAEIQDSMGLDEDASDEEEEDIGVYCQRELLDTKQLVYSDNVLVGMVQGPNYRDSSRFYNAAHVHHDPAEPLVWEYQKRQQSNLLSNIGPKPSSFVPLLEPTNITEELRCLHLGHRKRDLDLREEYKSYWEDEPRHWYFDYESEDEGKLAVKRADILRRGVAVREEREKTRLATFQGMPKQSFTPRESSTPRQSKREAKVIK